MSLSEKITMLRKERHWSQEELADRLDVSRQSVSKWESAASVPDIDRIIKLSEIFGVSLDYLLKEEREETAEERASREDSSPERQPVWEEPQRRRVDGEEAGDFLERTRRSAVPVAVAVVLCILSPVLLLLLGGMSEYGMISLTENMAGGTGLVILILLVGCAVAVFMWNGMLMDSYKFLEREKIDLDASAREQARQEKADFEVTHRVCTMTGVLFCIASVLPLFVAVALDVEESAYVFCVAALLVIVAAGVGILVWSGTIWGGFQKLLEEGDYTEEEKKKSKIAETIGGIYWCVVTAVYLFYSFRSMDWKSTWIIWPCAGILFGAVSGAGSLLQKKAGR